MTPARMRAIVAVADTGSVRLAAQELHVTESAISSAVTLLSREVGVALVERVGRGVQVTAAGAVFVGYARRVLGLVDEAGAAARGEVDPRRGRLRLAAVTSAGEGLLPVVLASFRRAWPDVEIGLEVAASNDVWQMLDTHHADLAIAGRPPQSMGVLVAAQRPNELVVVAAPNVAATFDWARTPWLMRESGSGTRVALEAYLRSRQAEPPRLVLGSNGAVVAGAAAGLGATLASRDSVVERVATGELVVLTLPGMPLHRPWHVVGWPPLSGTTRLFVDHLIGGHVEGQGWRRPRGRSSPLASPPLG